MVNYSKVMRGVSAYLDREILAKMGWQKWVLGTGLALYLENMENVYNTLKENELIKHLGVIDGDEIDEDRIYNEMLNQARKGSVSIELPLNMGTITLSERDVNLLHSYIINS